MMRITTETDDRGSAVGIDGHLSGDGVATLENALVAAGNVVRLELAGLTSADADGLAALRRLRAGGVTLSGVSPFLGLLLDSTADAADGPAGCGPT